MRNYSDMGRHSFLMLLRYFEVRPKMPGVSYRVTVYSGDWTRGT